MSKSNDCENRILALMYNATAWPDVAENDSSSPATNVYVALHTADPGEAGTQATNEANYTGYARTAVARTSGGWTVTGNAVANTATVICPACTGGSSTLTHFSTGTTVSGSTALWHSGTVTPNLAVSNGITPQFAAGDIDVTED